MWKIALYASNTLAPPLVWSNSSPKQEVRSFAQRRESESAPLEPIKGKLSAQTRITIFKFQEDWKFLIIFFIQSSVEFCKDFYRECPNSCTSKGYCVKGVCECRAGFGGADCSVAGGSSVPTPVDPCASVKCPINGSCSNGVCRCNVGFQGPNCERIPPPCPNKCSDRGTCNV